MYQTDIKTFNINNIIIYLRKSRKDLEYGNNESIEKTLQRHEEILQKWAINNLGKKIPERQIYREVASGDTIADRPVMQTVLKLIEGNSIVGVLCLEVERLARGNTLDQGIILQTFQYTNTKIITPQKVFDLYNDFDRSFFEDGLHQARKYLEYTKKILTRGRISSVNEGKYIGSITPYGYDKEKLEGQKGFKLIINPDEEKIVKIIFKLACNGVGANNIANHINKLGIKPRKTDVWVSATIRSIIQNPVYYGMIKWGHRKTEKQMINGTIYKSRPIHEDYILTRGLHDPIISKEEYDIANKNSKIKIGKCTPKSLKLENPLAGLVKCSFCGRTMIRRNYRSGHIDGLICPLPHCKNVGSHLYLVEDRIINSLKLILKEYKDIIENDSSIDTNNSYELDNLKILDNEIEKLNKQLNKAFDLLEQEIYDNDTFLNRSKVIKEKIKELEEEKTRYNSNSKKNNIQKMKNIIPSIENCLKEYSNKLSAQEKNDLLKNIISSIIYTKYNKGRGHEDEFHLKINTKVDL